jgi:hypothetical protein
MFSQDNTNWTKCPIMTPFYSSTKITAHLSIENAGSHAASEIQQSPMAMHTSYTMFLPQTYI